MRDFNRIQKIMDEVTELWKAEPDLRFGQFMSNLLGEICHKNNINDIFFPEDDKWMKWFSEYKQSHSKYNFGQNLKFEEDDDGK